MTWVLCISDVNINMKLMLTFAATATLLLALSSELLNRNLLYEAKLIWTKFIYLHRCYVTHCQLSYLI